MSTNAPDSFCTPKGTELPFLDMKGGKKYLQVMHRLVWFREERPTWAIKTELVKLGDDFAIFKAEILDDMQRTVQTGYGSETLRDFKDFLEKAETKAMGRALAGAGFGTQFAPEFDEGERLADSPAPLGKSQAAPTKPTTPKAPSTTSTSGTPPTPAQNAGTSPATAPKTGMISAAQRTRLWAIANECGFTYDDVHLALAPAGITSVNDLPVGRYDKFIAYMQGAKK